MCNEINIGGDASDTAQEAITIPHSNLKLMSLNPLYAHIEVFGLLRYPNINIK